MDVSIDKEDVKVLTELVGTDVSRKKSKWGKLRTKLLEKLDNGRKIEADSEDVVQVMEFLVKLANDSTRRINEYSDLYNRLVSCDRTKRSPVSANKLATSLTSSWSTLSQVYECILQKMTLFAELANPSLIRTDTKNLELAGAYVWVEIMKKQESKRNGKLDTEWNDHKRTITEFIDYKPRSKRKTPSQETENDDTPSKKSREE